MACAYMCVCLYVCYNDKDVKRQERRTFPYISGLIRKGQCGFGIMEDQK